FGAIASLGLTGAAIPGIRYGVRRLVNGLVRDLFHEDVAAYYRNLLSFAVPELAILETPYAWLEQIGSDALNELRSVDQLDQEGLAKLLQGDLSLPTRNGKPGRNPSKRGRPKRTAAAHPPAKRGLGRSPRRYGARVDSSHSG